MKNIKYGENKQSRTHTKTPSVTIQGNITAMRSRNGVIRSVFLLHIRANIAMILARDNASCHVARSTMTCNACSKQRAKNQMACKSLNFNPIDHLLYLLICKVRAQPLQLNLMELTRVIHQMCAAIPQQYTHRHILSMNTRYLVVDATPGGCTKY